MREMFSENIKYTDSKHLNASTMHWF